MCNCRAQILSSRECCPHPSCAAVILWADIFIGRLLANAEPTLEPAVRTGCDGFVWAHRPQGWACSSTEGSGVGFPGSVEKNLFVFSAMWVGEGVFQSGVRFVLGFGEMGCMVLEVLVVPGDDTISIIHHHLVWTSAKPWSLQKLSAAPSSTFCKALFILKCHPHYSSSSHTLLKDRPHSWNLATPKLSCCISPTNAEVVLALF